MRVWYLADAAAVSARYETDLLPDEHLRTRTEGRLRAGTSGYGEVRVGTVRLGVRVAACRSYGN